MAFEELADRSTRRLRRSRGGRRLTFGRVFRQFVLVCAAILALYPVWFMISTAFKTERPVPRRTRTGCPGRSSFANFSDALHGGEFLRWFKNARS